MGHNLNFNNEKNEYSFASTKAAWHGLGQIVKEAMTSEECIKQAHLDYTVVKMPLFAGYNHIEVEDKWATVRTDTQQVLGVVGNRYEVLQNKNAFSFFDAIVQDEKLAMFETAGAFGKGERIFLTAKLPNNIIVGKDDVIEQYLFLTNSHDGSGCITAFFTPVRVVCENTFKMAMKGRKGDISIRHTNNMMNSLKQAHTLLNITYKKSDEFSQTCEAMTKVNITDKELRKFLEKVMMPPTKETIDAEEFSTRFNNTIDSIMEYNQSYAQQVETTKGTLFGAWNAVTGYYSNIKEYKSGEDKLNQILYQTASRNNEKAFDFATTILSKGTSILN